MIEELPNINDLLDSYEEDLDWNELKSIYNELTDIVYKCLVELHPFLIQNNQFLPDDRHYILLYLFRTKRIFNSIILLLIYECYAEAKMLQRAYLENIVDANCSLKRAGEPEIKEKLNYAIFLMKRKDMNYIWKIMMKAKINMGRL